MQVLSLKNRGYRLTAQTQLSSAHICVSPLVPTNIVSGREPRTHKMPRGPDRWIIRGLTVSQRFTACEGTEGTE
jgi:hypothetical protein